MKGKPKTCGGCRAYEPVGEGVLGGGTIVYRCSLHYPEENGKPQERCPKPKTIRELIALGSALTRKATP